MNILITAANSAEAQKLKNNLKKGNIIMGDYLDQPAFMLNDNLIRLPDPKSNAYAHEMLTLCLDKKIDKIYLLREDEKRGIKKAGQLFKEFEIEIADGS